MTSGRLIVVCGLAAEAKIAAGRDRDDTVAIIAGGGDQARLEAEIEAAAYGASGIISFGVAGGLAPGLTPGDVRVADLVIAPGGELFTPHTAWAAAIRSGLMRGKWSKHDASLRRTEEGATRVADHETADMTFGTMPLARFAGVDMPLADVAGKAALHRASGADLVDMESHIGARIAARHGLPFAALRAVTDPAHRALPHAATVGMRPDGKVDLAAILGSLRRDPRQIPGLIRTGLDARAAFAALLRCRQLLGCRFASLDL